VGFLAATSGLVDPGRMEFKSVETGVGDLSILTAGQGDPVVCIHGLGGTKASFLTTIADLSGSHRVIAVDLPGFGDSVKPLDAPYNAKYFAGAVTALLDELGIDSAHLVGNSMGGRVAIEAGLIDPARVRSLVLLAPALAWLRDRKWRWLLRGPLPKLGLVQPAPRVITEPLVRNLVPGGRDGWTAAGVDEFLRSFLTPRGRVAFYESARNIYLDEPHGEEGLWTRMERMEPPSLFVWGTEDTLVPIGFRKHVQRVLPSAEHLILSCGHVPQMEMPTRTHSRMREFYDSL
jgi:pimeloyl-ACP methyl ester carboxylesterase